MKTTEKIKVNLPLIKMLKALDNPVRLLIVEYVLNSPPASLTDINDCIKENRGEIGTGILAFHLDILWAREWGVLPSSLKVTTILSSF